MTTTTFVNNSTVSDEDWFNDVDRVVYDILSDPATGAAMAANLAAYWPSFLAFNSASDSNQTGNGATATVDFDTEVFDVGSAFASDTFTAPTTGKYALFAQVTFFDTTTAMSGFDVNIVTSNRTYTSTASYNIETANDFVCVHISAVADMDSADTASVTVRITGGAGDTADILGHGTTLYTYFSGRQVA